MEEENSQFSSDRDDFPAVQIKGTLINDDWVRHDYYRNGKYSHSIAMPTRPMFSDESIMLAAKEWRGESSGD